MAADPNNGAFIIPAGNVSSTDNFSVPGDKTGNSPDGNSNPSQPSFDVDDKQRKHSKTYYIFIKNGWDVDIKYDIRGSHFADKEMKEPVIDTPEMFLEKNGGKVVIEDETGHSYMDAVISGLTSVPTSGELKIIFQARYR